MANQWWLRTQDEVFGPVTRENLLEWAQMGRIQPGQDVSSDGENWKSATAVDFLDMRWSIDIGDGTPRGPFNKKAAQALLASGRLPRGSRLVELAEEEAPEAEGAPVASAEEAVAPTAAVQAATMEELRHQIETLRIGLKAAQTRADEAERKELAARSEAKTALKAADVAEARLAAIQTEVAKQDAARDVAAADREKALEVALLSKDAEKTDALRQKEAEMAEALAAKDAAHAADLKQMEEHLAAELEAKDEACAETMRAKDASVAEARAALDKEEAEMRASLQAKVDECAACHETIAARDKALEEAAAALERERKATADALAKADAAAADLARFQTAKETSDAAYEDRIKALAEELKRLPPTAQLAADAQAAVYAIMKEEADELAATIEAENREAEALREYRRHRAERLLSRRQEILRRIGTDAEDMSHRALKEHPEDPRTMHMRQELEALRLLQEKSALEAERKIRDLAAKLRDREGELKRLSEQTADVTVIYRQLQDAREKLMHREKELMDERQRSEVERQQHAAAQQALITRLSSLELSLPGGSHQSQEARKVRLAPWMALKK